VGKKYLYKRGLHTTVARREGGKNIASRNVELLSIIKNHVIYNLLNKIPKIINEMLI
jgi:hypothetical protein